MTQMNADTRQIKINHLRVSATSAVALSAVGFCPATKQAGSIRNSWIRNDPQMSQMDADTRQIKINHLRLSATSAGKILCLNMDAQSRSETHNDINPRSERVSFIEKSAADP